MSINSEMTALANAVREKTKQSGALTIGQMTNGLNNIPTQTAKTITPLTNSQVAISSGTYVTGDIVIAGDENLISENIVEGVSIFGVDGTYKALAVTPDTYSVTVDTSGLHDIIGMVAYTGLDIAGVSTEAKIYGFRDGIDSYDVVPGSPLVLWFYGCPAPSVTFSNAEVVVSYNTWNRDETSFDYSGTLAITIPSSLSEPVTITFSNDGSGGV